MFEFLEVLTDALRIATFVPRDQRARHHRRERGPETMPRAWQADKGEPRRGR